MRNFLRYSMYLLSFTALPVMAGDINNTVPDNPDASAKYVFYMHGSSEESEGDNAKNQTAIAAVAEADAIVITEVRGDTDPNTYAKKIKQQVEHLLSKGVPASHISVTGFSKGALISLAVANIMNNSKINYVLLAGCSDWLNEKYSIKTDNITGRILAIHDADDDKFASCGDMIKPSDKVVLEEVELESGKGHILFRIPKEKFISQWRDPLISWVNN